MKSVALNLSYNVVSHHTGGFPGGAVVKNSPASAGDAKDEGSFPGSERSPGVGNGNPLQYSCLENSMNRRGLRATVHGVDWATEPPCTTSHWSEWPFSKSLQIENAGEGVEKRETSHALGGNVNRWSYCGEQYGSSLKSKNRLTIWSSNPTLGQTSRENSNSKRFMHISVHSSTIYNSQDTETI